MKRIPDNFDMLDRVKAIAPKAMLIKIIKGN